MLTRKLPCCHSTTYITVAYYMSLISSETSENTRSNSSETPLQRTPARKRRNLSPKLTSLAASHRRIVSVPRDKPNPMPIAGVDRHQRAGLHHSSNASRHESASSAPPRAQSLVLARLQNPTLGSVLVKQSCSPRLSQTFLVSLGPWTRHKVLVVA